MDIYRIVTQERTWDFNRGMKNELDEKKDRGMYCTPKVRPPNLTFEVFFCGQI